jgi:hypothetical protein
VKLRQAKAQHKKKKFENILQRKISVRKEPDGGSGENTTTIVFEGLKSMPFLHFC